MNVVPMDSERVLTGQTVVVEDARVTAIGPVDAVPVPAGARVIYGNGRWLVPGLVDMHVHIIAGDLPKYLEHGVTTVRDLAGLDSVLAVKSRGEGPRIFVASKLLTGPNPGNPFFSRPVTRVQDAAAAVDEQLARGCDSIKVYEGLSREVYDAIVTAAHARGVQVSGHVTGNVPLDHAMAMQDSIEHLSGYPLTGDLSMLAAASRESGVWNCPTMVVFRDHVTRDMPAAQRAQLLGARRALVAALRALVAALDAAGARILAGTDGGYLVPAGASLHDELAELRAAGLTNYEVLRVATRSAGEYLGDPGIGVIAPGAHADLVLVAANPLENLTALRRPAGVMLRGQWISYAKRRSARN
ncbi:MAG TPA: amidohydrolase family protein [Thermoanaerobaculia bacterium]|nr:amidohydrolase family protein [Thermoanaerobaculia bacterium]